MNEDFVVLDIMKVVKCKACFEQVVSVLVFGVIRYVLVNDDVNSFIAVEL
jgi:hypothetical protein